MQALPPKPIPKLPVKLFEDTSADGGLFFIATKIHAMKKQRDLKQIDFTNLLQRDTVGQQQHISLHVYQCAGLASKRHISIVASAQ
jgi:hypothetical protein